MTFSQHIDRTVTDRALEIRGLVQLGWSERDAIRKVRESSTLGPKTWDRVIALASEATVGLPPRISGGAPDDRIRPTPINPRLTSDSAQGGGGIDDVLVGHGD